MMAAHHRTLRREDPRLLTGQGTFIEGLNIPELDGALHGVFVRSIEPHGRLLRVDVADAREVDGVVAIYAGEDIRNEIWPLPPRLPVMNKLMVRPMLAYDKVRFVGEPLALVLATSRAAAVDAAELVVADIEPLPVVIDLDEALAGSTILHDVAATNVSFEWSQGSVDEEVFAGCEVVDEFTYRHPRLSAGPLEPRSGAAYWTEDGRAIVYINSQRPVGGKYVIECALGLEPGTVRAIAPDVGGGFGAKSGFGCYPEDVVATWAARQVGRPVRWTETRSEAMLAMGHGRGSTHHVRIGADADGRIKAYSVRALQDSGAYPAMGTFITSNLRNSGTGVYDIPVASVQGTSLTTNTNSTNAFRGAGRPEAACDIERAIDRLGVRLGIDPIEIRMRNLVGPDRFPYKTATGSTYDSGNYPEALRRCTEGANYEALRSEQRLRREAGDPVALGIGVSCTVEITGTAESEESKVSIAADGSVDVIVGTSPHGQGHETTFAALVAERLGVDDSVVTVRHSDTDLSPRGGGTIGSRSTQMGGSAAHGAALAVIEAGRARAAEMLEAAEADVVFEAGQFHVAGTPARSLTWTDLGPLAEDFKYDNPAGSFAFGACVAVVEVDTETGAVRVREMVTVDDAGVILQPMIAEGQIHGGLGLAVGAALYEEMVYGDDGVPRTGNFADYPLVSATEMPSFVCIEMETPSPNNPLGVKGVGESGTVVGTPAIHSAVLDALAPFGVEHLDLPLTPERVWAAING